MMSEEINKEIAIYSNKKATAYSFGQLTLIIANNSFSFLVFTFYFAVIGLNVLLISLGFLIWSIWNGINDPILGFLSDKTHTKWGRRRPYIIFALVPLALVMILLFTPPKSVGIDNQTSNFIYFLIIIMIFELFYSMYYINLTSLFPELFITVKERTQANRIRQTFAIVGLIVAFLLPTLFIADLSNPDYLQDFQIFGVVICIIVIIGGIVFLKFSPKEKPEFSKDYKQVPSFIESIKICFKSRSFRWYIPVIIANEFLLSVVPTLVALYGKFVLGIGEGESILLALLLGVAFISAALFINILWKPLVQKIGPRKSWMISMLICIISLAPLMFIQNAYQGFIVFFFAGIGIAGNFYMLDIVLSDIIDENEVNTGIRREASFYGVYVFFLRLAGVFVFIAIGIVFTNVGWEVFAPEKVTPEVIFGLRSLMFIYPALALIFGIIAMYKYPLDGEYLSEIKIKLEKLHQDKKSRI